MTVLEKHYKTALAQQHQRLWPSGGGGKGRGLHLGLYPRSHARLPATCLADVNNLADVNRRVHVPVPGVGGRPTNEGGRGDRGLSRISHVDSGARYIGCHNRSEFVEGAVAAGWTTGWADNVHRADQPAGERLSELVRRPLPRRAHGARGVRGRSWRAGEWPAVRFGVQTPGHSALGYFRPAAFAANRAALGFATLSRKANAQH